MYENEVINMKYVNMMFLDNKTSSCYLLFEKNSLTKPPL